MYFTRWFRPERWEFKKENKRVRREENTLSTKKAIKKKRKKKENTLSTKKATKKKKKNFFLFLLTFLFSFINSHLSMEFRFIDVGRENIYTVRVLASSRHFKGRLSLKKTFTTSLPLPPSPSPLLSIFHIRGIMG